MIGSLQENFRIYLIRLASNPTVLISERFQVKRNRLDWAVTEMIREIFRIKLRQIA